MPTNYVTATSVYLEKLKALGLNAAQTLNRLPRNELYRCYSWGHAIVDQVAGGGVTVRVSSLNGFRITFDPDTASPIDVSNINKLRNLKYRGSIVADESAADVPMSSAGAGEVSAVEIAPVIWNATQDTLDDDTAPTDSLFTLTPMDLEVQ